MRGVVIRFPRRFADLYRLIWNQSFDRLTDYLTMMSTTQETKMSDLKITAPENSTVIYMTRTFDAPRALVWKALSEPEHVVRWWGPNGYVNHVLEFDFRVGGHWKIKTEAKDGDVTFFGDYLAITKPVTITQTFSFDQLPPGMHSVDTVELTETDGKTIYKASSTFPDVMSRDGMMASGMERGVREGFARLDDMLADWKVEA